MNEAVAKMARTAAERLTTELSQPRLPAEVEAELRSEACGPIPRQYLDPISLAGLVVSVASLAWTIYSDLKLKAETPKPEVVARTIRVRLQDGDPPTAASSAERDRIIEVVVEETVNQADL